MPVAMNFKFIKQLLFWYVCVATEAVTIVSNDMPIIASPVFIIIVHTIVCTIIIKTVTDNSTVE